MSELLQDVRLAWRRLRQSPGFTLFAVASLALGIGVTTAIYSAVRTLLWMPLGVPHEDTLLQIRSGPAAGTMSWADFDALRRDQASFHAVGALTRIRTAVSGAGAPQTVVGDAVSGEFFEALELRPRVGRLILPVDEQTGAHVVILSQAFWRQACQSDPAIVGRTIRLGGQPFEVIGVVDGSFHGAESDLLPRALWIPITALTDQAGALGASSWNVMKASRSPWVSVVARLKADVTIGRAAAEVSLIGRRLEAAQPSDPARRLSPREWVVVRAGSGIAGRESLDAIVSGILTAIAMLLLIACTNLANLALARGTARAQEIAVRSALGASRWRLVREQLIETALLVAGGGAAGLLLLQRLLTWATVDLPIGSGAGAAMKFAPQLDGSVLGACFAAMSIAILVFGIWPALQSTRSDVREGLGAGHGATSPKWRLHRDIIAWQVCGSVALLLVAFLCAKIVAAASGDRSAGHHDGLALAQVEFRLNGKDEAQMRHLVESILDDARVQPGIRSVSASNGLPFGFWFNVDAMSLTTPDRASEPPASPAWSFTRAIAVTPRFFTTAGLRLTHGRGFNEQDGSGAPAVAIVTEEFARETFRTTDVVGRNLVTRTTMPVPGADRTRSEVGSISIIGVAADDEPWGNGRPKSLIFVPFAQRYQPYAPIAFLADAADARAGVAALRASIRRVDPTLSISAAGTGAVLLEGPLFLLRTVTAIAAALGAIGLVLAMSGLFGVLSHVVAKRTREMGIRIAVGADRADIVRLILRDGLHPVGKGLLLGLGIGAASRIAVKAFIATEVSAVDPWPLVLLPIPFVLAAIAACYIPAARASRVDPTVALRDL